MTTKRFDGRTALVTGGGTGIGYGIATRLAQQGVTVTLAARRTNVLEDAARRLRNDVEGAQIAIQECDVTVEDDVEAAVAVASGPDGQLDIAVANAGSGAPGPVLALTSEHWRHASDLNILGTALTIKHAARAMKERGGSIVAISSSEGFKIAKYMSPYTVTKAAVESLVRCAALELAPFAIRVNCIQPGFVPTEGTALAFDGEDEKNLIEITPLGRPGRPEEIGDAVLYFAAESGSWVTGQVLAVDGGMVIPEGVSFEKLCRKLYGDELMDECVGPTQGQKT